MASRPPSMRKSPFTTSACQARIPVIILDRSVDTDCYSSFIGGDNYEIGKMAGEEAARELPAVGKTVEQGEPFGAIESVKAVSDLYAPVSGEVVEVNDALADSPEVVNADCYGDGWMLVIAVSDGLQALLDPTAYAQHVKERAE